MATASLAMQPELKPIKVQIRWFDPISFGEIAKAPSAVFFEFNKGPDAIIESGHPKKDANTWDYELKVPNKKMLIGVIVGDQRSVFQITPDLPDGRIVDLPLHSVVPKTPRATIRVFAEEFVPTDAGGPKRRPLQGVTVSAELIELAGDRPKKPRRAKESSISSPATQGKAELKLGASGVYKVSVDNATLDAYAGSHPSLPLSLFVSTGEVVDLAIVFEPRNDLGKIEVSFVDESGKALANRKVYIQSKGTGVRHERITNAAGYFQLSVPKGDYEVFAEAPSSDFDVPMQTITV